MSVKPRSRATRCPSISPSDSRSVFPFDLLRDFINEYLPTRNGRRFTYTTADMLVFAFMGYCEDLLERDTRSEEPPVQSESPGRLMPERSDALTKEAFAALLRSSEAEIAGRQQEANAEIMRYFDHMRAACRHLKERDRP